jgi:glycosyltransferase involved in cell wall biosynthesis
MVVEGSSRPAVSVVMPNYNKGIYIREAIHSVLDQTFSNFELLVVDDCSTDGSQETIACLAAQDDRVIFHRLPRRSGAGAARNVGLRAARADVVALLDSDDLYSRTKLENQLKSLQCRNGSAVVYCDWWRVDGKGLELPPFWRSHIKKSGIVFGDLLVQSLGINTTVMAPKKFFEEVGLYDESLAYSEDHDMILKLAKMYPFAYLDEKLYGYRVHEGNSRNLLPREDVFFYKAVVTARHLKQSKELLTPSQRKAVEKHLLWYYAISRQRRKLLGQGFESFSGIIDLGKVIMKVGL